MLSVLRASRLFAALAVVASSGPVSAEPLIRITEVMSKAGDDDPTEDWFEITNYGTTAVDLTDWRMDDNSFSWAASVPLSPYTTGPLGNPWGDTFALNPGESAVFLESTNGSPFSTALPAFQTFWNLGPESDNIRNPKLGYFSGSGVSVSSGGDAVIIFNAAQQEVTRINFGAATTGSSFYWTFDAEGQLATARLGTVSVVGVADAYASTGGLNNTGSPGVAVVAADVEPLYWTGNGTSLGGTGVWDTSLNRWAPALTIGGGIPAGSATTWTDGASAIFDSNAASGGTVTVNADVSPLGVNILKDGYVLAAGSGSINTSSILVTTGTATVGARLTGDQTLGISGGGTLVLANPANDYTGITSVAEGTVRSGASGVIPDVSRLALARFTTYDFANFSDTVAGFAGLGTIRTDGVLTVNITDDVDRRLDGFLSGTGDLVIDSAGTGRQILNTSAQSLNIDFAVKDYSGATLIRRGTLAINETAQPIGTSGVTIQTGGRLELTSDAAIYQMGPSPATVVTLAGGTLGQEAGEDITLTNAINVTADSTIAVANSKTPDVLNPTIEFVRLEGPLAGSAERTLTLAASNTTPGEDRALVDFASPTGNTFAGTIAASVNMTARFAGDYSAASITLAGGGLEGAGSVGTVTGLGTVAPGLPDGDLAPGMGILTVSTLSAAGFDYQFEFQNAGLDPFWDTPDFSGNDVLRLTGSEPFGGASLSMANEVRLLLDVSSVAETDTFRGGFFSTADLSDEIADATYSVFVRDDAAISPDLTVSGVNYLSLASWNAANSTDYGAAIAMVAVDALFDGFTPTPGYVMKLALDGAAPPPPGPDYTGGYIVNPTVGDDENIPWGTVLAWAPTGPTEGLTFLPPKAGDSIAVNKLTAGRRNVDLGGTQAVGDIASAVDGNENAQTNGGVRFRRGVLTLDTGDGSESLVTYSGTGDGRLEFRFDGLGERLVLANDVRVVADNTAGRVDIRGTVSGSDTLTKAGPGELRFTATFDDTSGGNLFNATGLTGDIVVEQGVLQLGDQVTLPAVATVGVADGGQLRLAGAGTVDTPFTYSLGSSPLTLAGGGRSGVPSESGLGVRGALRYEPASGSRAVLANAVALAADVDIHVSGPENALTLSGGVTGVGGLTKSGGGTLVLAAANGYSGATRIDTGTLEVAHANSLGSSDVTVASGATLAVATGTTMKAPSVTLEGGTLAGSVAVNAATGVRRLVINSGSLSASTAVVVGPGGLVDLPVADRVTVGVASLAVDQSTGGGRVDLGAGELAVAAGGITAVDLRADILAGRNGGAWNGATGITSSAAAASGGSRAVGYVVAGDGSARVSFAAPGDTGLNGTVDVFDLVSVNSAGRYGTGTAAVWSQGDFNYDGVTNVFDLVSINTAGAYGQGNYFPAAASAGSLGSPTAVPEPGTLGLAALVAAAALGFQRRMR
jgi:fibronectin-binding autotransporter adhesin